MNERFYKWRDGLTRTRKSTFGRIATLLGASEISSALWDELEALLIQADLGVSVTLSIISHLQEIVKQEGFTRADELRTALREELLSRLPETSIFQLNEGELTVVLIAGVNGSGKTTTAAKLGLKYKNQGMKVLLAAADTYRAAAIEQLQYWGKKLNLRVIAGQPEGDPGAVTYDAVKSAISRNDDLLLVDTAGRLHTRFNLMEELKKVNKVAGKALPGAPHAVWLVMDSTTGQNALQQAKAFKEAIDVSGIILTKLDSSAKGGMVFALQEELKIPILFVGLGEKPEDLEIFDPTMFVDGILAEFN
ncbi:MAG: signal recognition particle-docking protein FtsY [Anaerolineales bacterium]|nr:signal recognition particle-docking protein FtsY [Anaerolineales bacterium]